MGMRLASSDANASADAVCSACNGGFLRIYAGKRPVRVEDAPTWQPLLVELRFGVPAFESALAGSAKAREIEAATAEATGTASWFVVVESDGISVIFDGTAGEDADLNLDEEDVRFGALVRITSLIYTQPRQGK